MPPRNWEYQKHWKHFPAKFDTLHLRRTFISFNHWGIPEIFPQNITAIPENLITYGFRDRFRTKRPILLHFHLDDYRFEIVWHEPYKGIQSVKRNGIWAVCSPDFSVYPDAPLATLLWNTYRNRWTARLWQIEAGVTIIPSISWGFRKSWDFCFAGVPKGQIINLRTYKTFDSLERQVFSEGYKAMCDTLEPHHILWFGEIFDNISDSIPKTQFGVGHWDAEHTKRVKGRT